MVLEEKIPHKLLAGISNSVIVLLCSGKMVARD